MKKQANTEANTQKNPRSNLLKNLLMTTSALAIIANGGTAFGALAAAVPTGGGGAVNLSTLGAALAVNPGNWLTFSAPDTLTVNAGSPGTLLGIDVANNPGGPTIVKSDISIGSVSGIAAGTMAVAVNNNRTLTLTGTGYDAVALNVYDKLGAITLRGTNAALTINPDITVGGNGTIALSDLVTIDGAGSKLGILSIGTTGNGNVTFAGKIGDTKSLATINIGAVGADKTNVKFQDNVKATNTNLRSSNSLLIIGKAGNAVTLTGDIKAYDPALVADGGVSNATGRLNFTTATGQITTIIGNIGSVRTINNTGLDIVAGKAETSLANILVNDVTAFVDGTGASAVSVHATTTQLKHANSVLKLSNDNSVTWYGDITNAVPGGNNGTLDLAHNGNSSTIVGNIGTATANEALLLITVADGDAVIRGNVFAETTELTHANSELTVSGLITGAVDNTDNGGNGILNFTGDNASGVTGDIGTTEALSEINIGLGVNNNANVMTTLRGAAINADTITLSAKSTAAAGPDLGNHSSTLILDSTARDMLLTGAIDSTAVANNGSSILTFMGGNNAQVTGTIGAGEDLTEVNFNNTAGTVTLDDAANATTFTIGGAGTVDAAGLITGKVVFAAAGKLNANNGLTGDVVLGNAGELVVAGANLDGGITSAANTLITSIATVGANITGAVDLTNGGKVETTGGGNIGGLITIGANAQVIVAGNSAGITSVGAANGSTVDVTGNAGAIGLTNGGTVTVGGTAGNVTLGSNASTTIAGLMTGNASFVAGGGTLNANLGLTGDVELSNSGKINVANAALTGNITSVAGTGITSIATVDGLGGITGFVNLANGGKVETTGGGNIGGLITIGANAQVIVNGNAAAITSVGAANGSTVAVTGNAVGDVNLTHGGGVTSTAINGLMTLGAGATITARGLATGNAAFVAGGGTLNANAGLNGNVALSNGGIVNVAGAALTGVITSVAGSTGTINANNAAGIVSDSIDLTHGGTITTTNGGVITINLLDGIKLGNNAQITSNGLVNVSKADGVISFEAGGGKLKADAGLTIGANGAILNNGGTIEVTGLFTPGGGGIVFDDNTGTFIIHGDLTNPMVLTNGGNLRVLKVGGANGNMTALVTVGDNANVTIEGNSAAITSAAGATAAHTNVEVGGNATAPIDFTRGGTIIVGGNTAGVTLGNGAVATIAGANTGALTFAALGGNLNLTQAGNINLLGIGGGANLAAVNITAPNTNTLTVAGAVGTAAAGESLKSLTAGKIVLTGGDAYIEKIDIGGGSLELSKAAGNYKFGLTHTNDQGVLKVSQSLTLKNGTVVSSTANKLDKINFTGNHVLTVEDGVNLYTANGITNTAVNQGSFVFTGDSVVTGAVGSSAQKINTITVNGAGGETVKFEDAVNANGAVTLTNGNLTFKDAVSAGSFALSANTTLTASSNVTSAGVINGGGTILLNNVAPMTLSATGIAGLAGINIAGSDVTLTSPTIGAATLAISSKANVTVAGNLGATNVTTTATGNNINISVAQDLTGNIGTASNSINIVDTVGKEIKFGNTSNFFGTVTSNSGGTSVIDNKGITFAALGSAVKPLTSATFAGNGQSNATYASDITIKTGASQTFSNIVQGNIALESATAVANFADKINAVGDITATGGGVANFAGGTFTGKIGAAAQKLTAVNFGGAPADNLVFKGEGVHATNINVKSGVTNISSQDTIFDGAVAFDNGSSVNVGAAKLSTTGNVTLAGTTTIGITTNAANSAGHVDLASNTTITATTPAVVNIQLTDNSNVRNAKFSAITLNGKQLTSPIANGTLNLIIPDNAFTKYSIDQNAVVTMVDNTAAEIEEFAAAIPTNKDGISGVIDHANIELIENNNTAPFASDLSKMLGAAQRLSKTDPVAGKIAMEKAQDAIIRATNPVSTSTQVVSDTTSRVSGAVGERMSVAIGAGPGNNSLEYSQAEGLGVAAGNEIDPTRLGAWVMPFYNQATQKARKNTSGYKTKTSGGLVGFDAQVNDRLTLGVAASYMQTDVRQKNILKGDKTKVKTSMISIYGMQQLDYGVFVQAITSFGSSKVANSAKRVESDADKVALGKYDTMTYGAEVLAGYNYGINNRATITPMAGLAYNRFNDGGYKETGTNAQNLSIAKKSSDKFEGVVGARASMSTNINDLVLTPEVHAFARIALKNKVQKLDVRLDGIATPLITKANKPAKASYNLGTSLTAKAGSMEYGIGYDAQLANKYVGHQGTLKLRVNF